MTEPAFTPLRSVLYMPSSNAKALEKAKTLPIDGVIFDLEDAVAPDAKPAAREAAAANWWVNWLKLSLNCVVMACS